MLTIDKERVSYFYINKIIQLENEQRRLGQSRTKQQIEKKADLEMQVELVNKNVQQVRQRLRERNAL